MLLEDLIPHPEHKITASHRPFTVHFNQMAAEATFWLVIVSRQKFPKLYSYLHGLDRNIYSHLYNLLEFYPSKNEQMSSFAVVLAVRSIAQ